MQNREEKFDDRTKKDELWDRSADNCTAVAAHLKRPNSPHCGPFGRHYFSQEKNPAFKWRGHTRWWWWKRWVLKRRNISVTLSPITPPHCVRPQFYSHAAYIWNSTIIIMISTTVIVGIVSSRSDDHPQIMNIVAKCFRSEAIQDQKNALCTLCTFWTLCTMYTPHAQCTNVGLMVRLYCITSYHRKVERG